MVTWGEAVQDEVRAMAGLEPRVVVPYVLGMVRDETIAELDRQWAGVLPVRIDPADDYAYGELVADLWAQASTLVICEQDVVPPPGSIAALIDCPQQWCVHEMPFEGRRLAPTLCLAKFAGSLMAARPRLARQALSKHTGQRCRTHWRAVDITLQNALHHAGVQVHVHQPPIVHLHDYGQRP